MASSIEMTANTIPGSSLSSSPSAPFDPSEPLLPSAAIAPWWHTVLVLLTLGAMSIAGWYQHGLPRVDLPGMSHRLSGYLTVIAAEWFLVLLIWLAMKHRGLSIGRLISGRWKTVGSFFRDLGFALGFPVIAIPLGFLGHFTMTGDTIRNLTGIPPKTEAELAVFLVLAAACGGFCEELIFRGYLTQQFGAWTGSRLVAIFLQGAVFGLAHGFYGKAMIVVMVLGWLLGLLAHWRKSLRPGMLAHGLQDVIGGVVAFLS